MKNFHHALLVVSILIFFGCENKTRRSDKPEIQDNSAILNDSLVRFDSLVNIYKVSNNAMARSYAKKALALAETSNSENAFAQAYLTMGGAYTICNDDSSVIYTSKSLQIANKIKLEKIRACALYNLAVLYTQASNKKEAAVFFDSVVTISRRNGFYVLLSNVYNAYGNLKFDIADNSGASIMYDSAYNVAS